MKNLLILALLIVGCVFAREYIAIIDFEGIGVTNDEARTLTQRLTSEMIKLEVYQVLERSEMKRLLNEQKFQYSGCVDLNCAVKLGKMLGAKYMVVGTVSKLGQTYSIDSRMIDVKTSEAYISGSFSFKGSIDGLLDNGMKSIGMQLCEMPINDKSNTVNISEIIDDSKDDLIKEDTTLVMNRDNIKKLNEESQSILNKSENIKNQKLSIQTDLYNKKYTWKEIWKSDKRAILLFSIFVVITIYTSPSI